MFENDEKVSLCFCHGIEILSIVFVSTASIRTPYFLLNMSQSCSLLVRQKVRDSAGHFLAFRSAYMQNVGSFQETPSHKLVRNVFSFCANKEAPEKRLA